MDAIAAGLHGSASVVVGPGNLAVSDGDTRRQVFSTPAMVALVEQACFNATDHLVDDPWVSVGTEICLQHVAPAGLGATVVARAQMRERDRNVLRFGVDVFCGDRLVGHGTHERRLVDLARLHERAGS